MFDSIEYALLGTRSLFYNHVFSAEKNPSIRTFIKMSRPTLRTLFTSIEALQHKTALNDVGSEQRATPQAVKVPTSIWCYIAGFVCKDISSLNGHCSANRAACATGTARTGETWTACVMYLKHHRPLCAVFENVAALASKTEGSTTSNLEVCLADCKALGYQAVAVRLCPRGIKVPVTRDRCYIIASRVLTLAELESVADGISAQSHTGGEGSDPFPLSMFLLPDGHPLIQAEYDRLLEAKGRTALTKARSQANKSTEDCKWVLEHALPFCGSGSRVKTTRYSNPTTASAWLDLLQDREIQNLSSKPFTTGIAELSQTEKREVGNSLPDGCPCVIPNGIYMHLEKLRLLCPLERLCLQGIPCDLIILDQYEAGFWNEMSGNSFNAYMMSVIMSSLLLVFARKAAAASTTASTAYDCITTDITTDSLLLEGLGGIDLAVDVCNDLLSDVVLEE